MQCPSFVVIKYVRLILHPVSMLIVWPMTESPPHDMRNVQKTPFNKSDISIDDAIDAHPTVISKMPFARALI
jgi:hypothetical protein